jgi:5'-nucleotidase
VDFSAAGYFTAYFGRILMAKEFLPDVDVLKVDVPTDADTRTPWQITRLSDIPYFEPVPPERDSWNQPGKVNYRVMDDPGINPPDTDVYALRVKRVVSVTPLSLDLTSRVDLKVLDRHLRGEDC